MSIVFMKRKQIVLGEQSVSELTVLEWKKLFSIKLFHFHKTTGDQDRFHTHAFNSISFLLHGDYIEEVIDGSTIRPLKRSRKWALFIARDTYHRITKSDGCRTLLVTGPWGEEFKELRHLSGNAYQEVVCGASRKELRIGEVIKLEGR